MLNDDAWVLSCMTASDALWLERRLYDDKSAAADWCGSKSTQELRSATAFRCLTPGEQLGAANEHALLCRIDPLALRSLEGVTD